MRFILSIEDHTIILNALHYYRRLRRKNFQRFDETRINQLRDSLVHQLVHGEKNIMSKKANVIEAKGTIFKESATDFSM